MNSSRRLLIILAKNPEAGLVKTRLAKTIGNTKALEIYKILLHHTATVAAKAAAERMVFYSSFLPNAAPFFAGDFMARLQEGNDLGERMLHAISHGFESGFRNIVLIGTDCYELSPAILENAFSALEHFDAVIGPAKDGGFYLIGMNNVIPELFLDRQWSTPDVLQKSIAILQQHDITYELLMELSDIDTFDDLKKSPLWMSKP